MTKNLEITPEAEQDITAITLNILQQSSLEAAKTAALEFQNQLNQLMKFSDKGRPVGSDGNKEIVLIGLPYVAVYNVSHDTVTIIRILYAGSQPQ